MWAITFRFRRPSVKRGLHLKCSRTLIWSLMIRPMPDESFQFLPVHKAVRSSMAFDHLSIAITRVQQRRKQEIILYHNHVGLINFSGLDHELFYNDPSMMLIKVGWCGRYQKQFKCLLGNAVYIVTSSPVDCKTKSAATVISNQSRLTRQS